MHPKTHFFSFELASSFQKWLTLFTFSKKNHINIYSIAQENVANWVLSSNWYKIDVIFKLVHRYLERYSYFGVMCRCVHSYLCVCMIPPRLIPSLSIFNRGYAISHQPWSFLWSESCCYLLQIILEALWLCISSYDNSCFFNIIKMFKPSRSVKPVFWFLQIKSPWKS